jgi:hypothetical protein
MAGWRKAIELAVGEEDLAALRGIARSRTEPASRVERARMVLAYRDEPSFFKVGRAVGAQHQTVQRCVERALAYGPMAALDDRPRPGKEPTITAEAKAWVADLACARPRNSNYLHDKIAGVLGNNDAIITIHGGTHRDERRRLQALFRSDPEARGCAN